MSWAVKKLDEIADFHLGKMLDEKKNKGDPLPYLANVNVRWGEFELDDLRLMRFETSELERFSLEYGDIVMCEGGEPGRCAIWKDQLPKMMYQKALHRIRPRDGVDNRFLYYAFLHKGKQGGFSPLFTGSTIKHLPKQQLAKVEVEIPDLSGQERIVEILCKYDDLIENNKRRIELLEDSARQLYKEWFVRFRFPGHEHVKIIDGVPEGWERLTVAGCCEKPTYGYTASADVEPIGPKFLRITDIVPSSIDWPNVPHCLADESTAKKYILSKGDIVVARTGATVGYAKLMPELNEEVVYASYLVRFRPKPEIIDEQILGIFVESEGYKEHVRAHAGGAAQPNANAQVLGSATLNVPPLTLQIQFKDFVEPVLKQKSFLEKTNFSLAKARDLLLPRLMSGEIAV